MGEVLWQEWVTVVGWEYPSDRPNDLPVRGFQSKMVAALTADHLTFSVQVAKGLRKEWVYLFVVPTSEIEDLVVEGYSSEQRYLQVSSFSGFSHGTQVAGPTTGVLVKAKRGWIACRIEGAPFVVKQRIQPLLRYAVPEPVADASRTAPAGSFIDELERLDRLRQSGALTQSEFDTAKRKLLGG